MNLKKSFPVRVFRGLLNIPEDLPDYVQIEITNICNLDCRMCTRNFITLEKKHMDFRVFKAIVDQLQGVKTLTLTGYGEPLLYPNIIEAITYCKQRGFEVQITSNGLLLNSDKKIRKVIESGLDSIAFSLESIHTDHDIGHPTEHVLDNIQRFIALKKTLQSSTPMITLQTLMIKTKEQDLYDVIEWGASHGADRINVARFDLNTLSTVKRPDTDEEKIIFREFAKFRKKYGIRIDCIQDQFYTGFKGILYKQLKYFLGLNRNCIRLRDFTYVNVNGNIRPCCALVNHTMGSLIHSDLKQIWTGGKYDRFRKTYRNVPWCAKCDIFTLRQK